MSSNIHPEFERFLKRTDREKHLKQKSIVIWLYGLSGSGKSTLANALDRRLHKNGFHSYTLDGDNLRTGLNNGLGFSDEDRYENIRRAAEVAKLFLEAGTIVITSFITPQKKFRSLAKEIIGAADFLEVYLQCSFEQCAKRDVKGLYQKAQKGQVEQFTGHKSTFEAPDETALVIDTENQTLDHSVAKLYQAARPKIIAPGGTCTT